MSSRECKGYKTAVKVALPTKLRRKMSQEIFYWLIALFMVAALWGVGRLVAGINRGLNNCRIQRGIAEYLLQRTAEKS